MVKLGEIKENGLKIKKQFDPWPIAGTRPQQRPGPANSAHT
jgi:hypothetical protein